MAENLVKPDGDEEFILEAYEDSDDPDIHIIDLDEFLPKPKRKPSPTPDPGPSKKKKNKQHNSTTVTTATTVTTTTAAEGPTSTATTTSSKKKSGLTFGGGDAEVQPHYGRTNLKTDNLLSLMASVAAKSAILKGSKPEPTVDASVTTALAHVSNLKAEWLLDMKCTPFKDIIEEDSIKWINHSKKEKQKDCALSVVNKTSTCMLNPSRQICGFLHITPGPKPLNTFYCNFCKLTEKTLAGFNQHLNHHLFVCGVCAFHSASRLDVELHRQRMGHVTELTEGYMVHKQGLLNELLPASEPSPADFLMWKPIREKTEALIIMESDSIPESMRAAYDRAQAEETDPGPDVLQSIPSVVCALAYYRYVASKSNRRHVLEFHCNFCQSTPCFTQELYRHVDFHLIPCQIKDCSFKAFTLLEVLFHQRKEHYDVRGEFLDDLIVFSPSVFTKESEFMAASAYEQTWNVVLQLPKQISKELVKDRKAVQLMDQKEAEWRCRICNLIVINKGGMISHLKFHGLNNIQALDFMNPL